MLFSHPLYKPFVERVGCVQLINKLLVVFHRMFVLALADSYFRESCSIAQHQLRSEILYQRHVRFAATLHAVWLIDNKHRPCVGNGIDRPMKVAKHLVIVVTGEQLAVGEQLSV